MGPNPMTGVLIRRGKFGHRHREDSHVKMETETGVMRLQAKDCWQPSEARRGKEDPPLQRSEGAWPC